MKTSNSILSILVALFFVGTFTMSFTLIGDGNPGDEKTTSEVGIDDAQDHCCCPPGWVLVYDTDPDGAGYAWDNNGDGLFCAKGAFSTDHPSDGTPNGKGNSPSYGSVNVKDNNNKCKEGDYNPCE